MAETVKKSRIVSDDVDLEETLMEEFNLRLKNCLSQDPLEISDESEQKLDENLYENIEIATKNFIETEKYIQSTIENNKSNGHDHIYENVQKSNDYIVMSEENNDNQPIYEEFNKDDVAFKPSFTLFPADCSMDEPQENVEVKSVKDRMLLSSDDTSTLLFTQTVTSPMLTPSEENVDFLKGFRRESTPSNSSPKDNSQSDESLSKMNGKNAKEIEDEEIIDDEEILPPAERIYDEVQENIYENLEQLDNNETIYENVEELKKKPINDCFNKLEESFENSTCQEDSETISEVVSQIEQPKMYEFDDENVYNSEISDVISEKKILNGDENKMNGSKIDDNDSNKSGDFIRNVELLENEEVCNKSPTPMRIVDELAKNYTGDVKDEISTKNREKDTETVPPKIVQNLTSQFMKNSDGKKEKKQSDVNQLKSIDIMKQINKFEQKDENCDSTQITESYVETTTSYDTTATTNGGVIEKGMKKKKTKKSRKEEKENISVNHKNNNNFNNYESNNNNNNSLDAFYNVNVKNLCRSFGDLTKIDEKSKPFHNPQIRYTIDRTRSKSLSDTYLTSSNQKYYDKVLSGVSVKALKEKFNTHQHGQDKTDNKKRNEFFLRSYSNQNISMKSSFSKFDALQKKNVLHIRSSDSAKAQEKFNGTSTLEITNNCKCCGKQVFQMEQIKAEKAIWHKNCFRCNECSKQLNVDTYESHEGTLYCKPHFKALFAPKAVDDSDEPPSDKPDLGLEELQSLNVKQRFQVFEQQQTTDGNIEKAQVNVKRSASILSKLAKFQAKGMDVGVSDDSLNGIPIEESSSGEEEEENDEDIPDGEDPDLVRAKRVQKEKPFHFTGMSDVKNKWEHGGEQNSKDERREERKQEIQSIRNKLFMGKQGKMKEAYQEAVMKSESSVNVRKEDIQVCDTKTIKERFEKGEIVHEVKDEDKDEEIFESEISKKSRSLFLQLDANASKPPQMSPITPPKLEVKKAREGSTPEREIYHDPDIVRSEEIIEDSVIAKETHTATKMLNKFRQMEENSSKEPIPQGPKPLKCFTPPPEPSKETESSSEEGSESEEEIEEIDHSKVPDEDLIEAQKAARAKQLRAKFEKWEAQEIKREQNNSSINIMEEYGEEQSQIESTKLLRARFESMKENHTGVTKPRVKVNRFVELSNIMENCEGCDKRVYPLEKISVHGHLYHKTCFKCKECSTVLRMDSYTYNQGRLYCTPHFKRLFITKGNYDSAFGLDGHEKKWNSAVA